ncbi:hypothetical protein HK100_000893 [Physocladia obscura]|uniref:Uncharacterized protein n=1 Tax=Physocladia obscura TaxID=109957 RepID=A0AAD5SXZ8_9FUNG|nr:hypothetical protein HK100_000893 [Physocladia obscura]
MNVSNEDENNSESSEFVFEKSWSVAADPTYVAFWKEHLAKEGREWIEPIPESMQSWWPLHRKNQH